MNNSKNKSNKRQFRFGVRFAKLEMFSSANTGFLSTQKNKKNSGRETMRVNSTMQDVIAFVSKYENQEIVFDPIEELYRIGQVCYTKNQLLYKANKMRKYLNLNKFIIDN